MASVSQTHDFHHQKICPHLSLTVSSCSKGQTCSPPRSSTKRKSCVAAPPNTRGRKRYCKNNTPKEERHWGCTTDLKLFDDPWKIKKELRFSDLGNSRRLLLPKDLVHDFVLPVLSPQAQRETKTEEGTKIAIWDVDTQSMYCLDFKQCMSNGSYVFISNWMKDFVKRRGLKIGDEIGLHWDPYKNRFDFSVLARA